MSAGPAVGGLLLASLGWRWLFWVCVPIGIAAAAIGWLALPQTKVLNERATFDWRGALLLGPALICLVLVLNQVSAWAPPPPRPSFLSRCPSC